jgi:hypothetical protein
VKTERRAGVWGLASGAADRGRGVRGGDEATSTNKELRRREKAAMVGGI